MRLMMIGLCWLLCAMSNRAQGDLILDVRDATLSAGGTGFVDVYLTGAPGDLLGRFGYQFNITGAIAQSGDLQFQATQSKSEQDVGPVATLAEPAPYVFFGDTDPGNLNSARGSLGTDPLVLEGGDSLLSLDYVSVDGTFLLARLELQHDGQFSLASHDFTVTLNLSSPVTEFDRDFDPLTDNNYTLGQLTALSGTVTVTASAVPEPSSVAVIGLAGIGMIVRRRLRQQSNLWRRLLRNSSI